MLRPECPPGRVWCLGPHPFSSVMVSAAGAPEARASPQRLLRSQSPPVLREPPGWNGRSLCCPTVGRYCQPVVGTDPALVTASGARVAAATPEAVAVPAGNVAAVVAEGGWAAGIGSRSARCGSRAPEAVCVALPKARWPGAEVGAAAGAGAELPGVFHPGRSCPRCGCPSGGPLSGGRGRWRCSPRRRPPPCPRQAGEPSLQMCWLRGLALTAQVMGRPLEGGALGPVVAPGLCEEDRRTYGTGRWAAPSRRPASSCISPAVGSCWGLAGQAGAGGVPAASGPAGPQNARAAVRLSTRRPPSHPEARCGCATRRLPSPG